MPQKQRKPGIESEMHPRPVFDLKSKMAARTGGDSGIGKAVAILFAKEGATVSFTCSLASNPVEKHIRVNAVAPAPVWTPLIPASFDRNKPAQHGSHSPMKRAAEPVEIAPSYLFLACRDSAFMTGQVLHPNGGKIING